MITDKMCKRVIYSSKISFSFMNKGILLATLFFCVTLAQVVSQQSSQGNTDELLALQYFNNQEFDKAVVLYEKLFNRNQSLYLYNYYFECLIALEDFKKAERVVTGLIKKNPTVFRYQVDEGYIYLKSGDQRRYNRSMQGVINNIVPTIDNYLALAQYFQFRKLPEWSVKTYEKAIEIFPNTEAFRYELISLYYASNQFDNMFGQVFRLIDNPMTQLNQVQERMQAIVASDASGKVITDFIQYTLRLVQRNPQNSSYADMLLWAYIQNSDFERAMTQAIAMDRRQNRQGQIVVDIVPIYIKNKAYDDAKRGINYIIDLGKKADYHYVAKSLLIDIQYQQATSVIPPDIEVLRELEKNILALIEETGIHLTTVSLIQKLAEVQAYFLDLPHQAKEWIDKALLIPRLQPQLAAVLKIQKADIMLMTGEHWDASLLYSQVEKDFKHDTIGFQAKFKNAKFYYFIGEFEFAQTHLRILQGSTSKLIANDAMELNLFIMNNVDYDSSFIPLQYYSKADFQYATKQYEQSLQTLDSLLRIFPFHPIRDDAFMLKARIFIYKEEYQKAAHALHQILALHYTDLLADDALYILADLYRVKLNNPEKAMELYWQIVADFPSSVYAQEAREIYRKLRDNILIQ